MTLPILTNLSLFKWVTKVTQEVLHFVQMTHAGIVTKQEDISSKM